MAIAMKNDRARPKTFIVAVSSMRERQSHGSREPLFPMNFLWNFPDRCWRARWKHDACLIHARGSHTPIKRQDASAVLTLLGLEEGGLEGLKKFSAATANRTTIRADGA